MIKQNEIPDANFYKPLFSPWLGFGDFGAYFEAIRHFTIVSADRCYVLYSLAKQAINLDGQWYEAGVYKGGTGILLAKLLSERKFKQARLHLFDTFEGMPEANTLIDIHKRKEALL